MGLRWAWEVRGSMLLRWAWQCFASTRRGSNETPGWRGEQEAFMAMLNVKKSEKE